jgi:hypothetical protein
MMTKAKPYPVHPDHAYGLFELSVCIRVYPWPKTGCPLLYVPSLSPWQNIDPFLLMIDDRFGIYHVCPGM